MRHAGQETEQNMGAGYSAVNEQCGKRKPPPWKGRGDRKRPPADRNKALGMSFYRKRKEGESG